MEARGSTEEVGQHLGQEEWGLPGLVNEIQLNWNVR